MSEQSDADGEAEPEIVADAAGVSGALYDDPYEEGASERLVGTALAQMVHGDWLDSVASKVLLTDVSFQRIASGSRDSFSVEDALSVLSDTDCLRHLGELWKLKGPGVAILSAAAEGDERGAVHRRLLRLTGYLTPLPSQARLTLAASTGRTSEILTDRIDDTTVVDRRLFTDQDFVEVVITTGVAIGGYDFPVIAVLPNNVVAEGHVTLLLITSTPASGDAHGRSECAVPLDSSVVSADLLVSRTPVEAAQLSGALLDAVPRSVAVAKLPWKDAWRRAALASPPEHPLRQAVLAGLTTER